MRSSNENFLGKCDESAVPLNKHTEVLKEHLRDQVFFGDRFNSNVNKSLHFCAYISMLNKIGNDHITRIVERTDR